jgi:alpha-L-rhamnosidase
MGGTTIWERWDSMLPDGSINTGEMTSFNHYALGAVADFLHRVVAGLAPATPGYRNILFRPRPGGGLTSAAAHIDTVHGRASIGWKRHDDALTVRVEVPAGCRGILDLDRQEVSEVGPGTHTVTVECRPASDDPPRPARRTPFDEIGEPVPED